MDTIRLATPEEIETIKAKADITGMTTTLAFPGTQGTDFAVIRSVTEVDPVIFAETSSTQRRALFIWGIEIALRALGNPAYYFNVLAADEDWQKAIEHWGAERLSMAPEYRYRKSL